ncbi:MAG: hypothetical protein JWM59_4714 [Verrucomicrobiales bacterium]|nr:hypothetical protein [Verrucomicrobiales bacterium]
MFTAPDSTAVAGRVPRFRAASGMTLLEVVVGLAILALMAGAIHAIVSGTVEATGTLAASSTEDRRMEAFLNRTRLALGHLPEQATIELKVLENSPLRQEFILRGVPDAWIWGPNPRWDKPVVTLCANPWSDERRLAAKGREFATSTSTSTSTSTATGAVSILPPERYSLAMSVPDFFRVTDEGEPVPESPMQSRQGNQFVKSDLQGRFWVDLLPEVSRVEWRFYDPAKKIWLEQSPPARPPLIELKLFLPGRTTPERTVLTIA